MAKQIVAGLRTGEVSSSCPILAERNELLTLLMHHTNTEESVAALAEEDRKSTRLNSSHL